MRSSFNAKYRKRDGNNGFRKAYWHARYECCLYHNKIRNFHEVENKENGEWHYYRFKGQTKWNELLPTSESRQEQMKYMMNQRQ